MSGFSNAPILVPLDDQLEAGEGTPVFVVFVAGLFDFLCLFIDSICDIVTVWHFFKFLPIWIKNYAAQCEQQKRAKRTCSWKLHELEGATPFARKIHADELWLYKNPRSDSYVPTSILWPLVFITPTLIICIVFVIQRDKVDISQAILGLSLALSLNGALTNMVKVIVGRPRPDFFWRCFPDGEMNPELECTGEESVVLEGRKSFPSGHSSFSFTSMGFIAFYLAGKLHVFNTVGRGQSWRLCLFILPLVIALGIALSRTCDYHHHWQDVLCGSILGLCISYMCYRQYYPCLGSLYSHHPYANLPSLDINNVQPGHGHEEQVKWI